MKLFKLFIKEAGLVLGMGLLLLGWLIVMAALGSLSPLLFAGGIMVTAVGLVELGRMEIGPLW